jgi:hypothetical protein
MNNFKLKFDGQIEQIDANILVNSLIHTSNVVQEINRYLDTGKKIEIKVQAPEKGCFLIQINLIETVLTSIHNIFTKDNINITADIITTLIGLITIVKFLKGRKASEIRTSEDTTIITNQEGNELRIDNCTYNIYEKSSVVKDSICQNFESIQNDPSITAYEITDINENTLVRVDRNEFELLSRKSEELLDNERILTEIATLHVVRVAFEEALKWDFYFKGNKISAKIKDPSFYKTIDKGESFAKGDTLEVELQIIQKWEESVNTYINKSYQITGILRHLPKSEQQKLKFEE